MFEDRLRHRLKRWSQSRNRIGQRAIRVDGAHQAPRRTTTLSAAQTGSQLALGQEVKREEGKFLLIERTLRTVAPTTARSSELSPSLEPDRPDVIAFRDSFPQTTLFLDLETCGLAGSAIFLAGLIRWKRAEPFLTQLWTRNYAEEAAMIAALGEIVRQNRVLVTFNGKSFDWPQVRDRATRYAARPDAVPELSHFDLLHHCRRRYGKQFGNCKLQTLETHVCGRHRVGDIPGREIPAVYAEYVHSQNSKLVEPILHHNALDLITLWELALR